MIREKIRVWFLEEREKLESMTSRGKWEYIWGYYKWWILGLVLAVIVVVSGVRNAQYQRREILVSGAFINTATSAEGYAFVSEDYWEYAGADKDTRVELIEARAIRYHVEQPTSSDVNAILAIDAQIASKTLDYIIGDISAMEFYDQQEALLDLQTLFTKEQLRGFQTVSTENGIVAVKLTDSKLSRQFGLSEEPAYLFFFANSPRVENCTAFLYYLFQD